MEWQSAALGTFDGELNISKKLESPKQFSREDEEFKLTSAIRADETYDLPGGGKVIMGTYVDEIIVDSSKLVIEGSTFYITKSRIKIPKLGSFVLASNGLAYTNRLENREGCFRILSRLLSNTDKFIQNVTFDIAGLDKAYDYQWVGNFYGRNAEVDKGTLYSKNGRMKDDKDFGKAYTNSKKNEIGIFAKSFGKDDLKMKITSRGSVTFMDEIRPDLVMKIIQKELLPFMSPIPKALSKK